MSESTMWRWLDRPLALELSPARAALNYLRLALIAFVAPAAVAAVVISVYIAVSRAPQAVAAASAGVLVTAAAASVAISHRILRDLRLRSDEAATGLAEARVHYQASLERAAAAYERHFEVEIRRITEDAEQEFFDEARREGWVRWPETRRPHPALYSAFVPLHLEDVNVAETAEKEGHIEDVDATDEGEEKVADKPLRGGRDAPLF